MGCMEKGTSPSGLGRNTPLGPMRLGLGETLRGGGAHPSKGCFLPSTAHEALRERWPLPGNPRNPSGGPGTIPICPRNFPVSA